MFRKALILLLYYFRARASEMSLAFNTFTENAIKVCSAREQGSGGSSLA